MERKRRNNNKFKQANDLTPSLCQNQQKLLSAKQARTISQNWQIFEEQIPFDEESDISEKVKRNNQKRVTLASKNIHSSNATSFAQQKLNSLKSNQNFRFPHNNSKPLQEKSTKQSSKISLAESNHDKGDECQLLENQNTDSQNNQLSLSSDQIRNLTFQSIFQILQENQAKQPKICIRRSSFVKYKRRSIRDEYEILEKVGEGSFGNVYKCQHKTNKAIRSVKIIKNKALGFKNNRQTLKREIQILKKLDHPSILKIFQVYQFKNTLYIVCEYCGGGTLKSYLSGRFKFSNQMKIVISQKILQSVSYMHKMGVIHRDLKPQNILFVKKISQTTNLDNIDIRIIDFGLSIEFKQREFRDWAKIGTMLFMAPQVFKGIYSPKADAWSCGVIMHILFLSYNPFAESQDFLVLEKIENYKLQNNPKLAYLQKPIRQILTSLLNVNYVLRGQVQTIIQKQYFQQFYSNQYIAKQTIVSEKIGSLKRDKNLVAFLKYYLTFNKISQKKVKQLADLFNFVDVDKNGVITQQQLCKYLVDQGQGDQLTAKQTFSTIDCDHSGTINFGEFLCAISNKNDLFTIENINQIFSQIDISKDGLIDLYQFKHFLADFNKKGPKNIQQLFEGICGNKENKISPNQFLWYILDQVYLQPKQ